MTAHVDIARPIAAHRLADGTNARLRPLPVAILYAEAAAEDFHARFSCVGRRYLYRIVNAARRWPSMRTRLARAGRPSCRCDEPGRRSSSAVTISPPSARSSARPTARSRRSTG